MPDGVAPYLVRGTVTDQGGPRPRAIVAYRIPYLPDLVSWRRLGEHEEREAARGVLRAQASLIAALADWQGQAFALRYLFRPERRAVEIALLLRADAPAGQAPDAVVRMGERLVELLAGAGIAAAPVAAEAEALALLYPPGHRYIAEIRQHEELVPLRMGDAYVVSPLRPTMSSWLATFDRLMQQQAPCLINVHLQPTRLSAEEREAFEQAASLARGLKDFQHSGYGGHLDLADPMAGTVAAVYEDVLQRLAAPFLMVVQVASPSADAVRAVGGALMGDVSETVTIRGAQTTGELPCGCDLAIPQSPEDALAAYQTLSQLELQAWGTSPATAAQRRLRFLMDAPTAAAAFRFPLPTRTGVPGVEVRVRARGRTRTFLSYRRDDSAAMTGRIYDRLAQRFGEDAVYLDVTTVPLGTDFVANIREALRQCAVQLVIIGPRWLDARDAAGERRIDDPGDYVRLEVEVGLASDFAVIPILVDGATMPAADRLPASLAGLPLRNGRPVRHADFDQDMQVVIAAIEDEMRRAGGSDA